MAPNPDPNGFASRYQIIIQTTGVMGMVIAAFWAGVISPIASRLDKIEANEASAQRDNRSDYLSILEHTEFKGRMDRAIDQINSSLLDVRTDVKAVYVTIPAQVEFKAKIEQTLNRLDAAIEDIRKNMVPLSTHQQKWDSDRLVVVAIQKQVDEMRAQAGSSFTLGDKLKELQHQLDDIRAHQMVARPP